MIFWTSPTGSPVGAPSKRYCDGVSAGLNLEGKPMSPRIAKAMVSNQRYEHRHSGGAWFVVRIFTFGWS